MISLLLALLVGAAPADGPGTADAPAARVAILADDFPARAGAASAETVAAIASKAGYEAQLMTADEVADADKLNRRRFDVLVVPCAPYYPAGGRAALVRFLKSGGSLVSIGGYAFDAPVEKTDAGWKPVPSVRINTRFGRPGDTMGLERDQIGAFDPSYLLEDATYATPTAGQTLLTGPLRVDGPLEGFAACVMAGSNSPVFPDVYARWIPLLNTYDEYGRLRGAAAAVAHRFDGPFRGSSWALFGVTNRDLIGGPHGEQLLTAALRAVTGPAFLYDLRTEFACYGPGEPVTAAVEVANHGRSTRHLALRFVPPTGEPIVRKIDARAGDSESVRVTLFESAPQDDFVPFTAELVDPRSGEVLDRMETAFVVWSEAVVRAGPKIAFVDDYFTLDGVPRFFCGTNQTGMMWHSRTENPLTWQRDFAKMQNTGIRMLRILHFSPFAAEDPPHWSGQGVAVLANRPKRLLRQTDAIVQLAQKHGVVICLTLHDWMPVELSDREPELQREWARFWAERYRNVPGILYDVQNEPRVRRTEPATSDWTDATARDAELSRIETLNRWIGANVAGVKQGDPEALVTVGFLQMMSAADKVLGVRHQDFNDMHSYNNVDDFPARFKLTDRRFVGKSLSLGEFGAREAHDARVRGHAGTRPEESIRRFLSTVHYTFGLGGSMALNWDWKDFDGCVFPWGLNHRGDLASKPVMDAYRNIALCFERLRPRYEDPGLYLLVPDSHRVGPRSDAIHAAVYRAIDGLLANHVDFNVANEWDLDKLPRTCRTMLWPIPYCPDDATFKRVAKFVREGGTLYVSGDITYDRSRKRTRTARFAALGLEDPGPHLPFGPAAKDRSTNVQKATAGEGRVFFVPTPIELDSGPVVETYREFLQFADEERIPIQPDHPKLHVFRIPLVDGTATVVCNRTESGQRVRLGAVELAVGKELTGLIVTDNTGRITTLECTGYASVDGTPVATGDAHMILAAPDDGDVRKSADLTIYPILPGKLVLRAPADVQQGELEICDRSAGSLEPLARENLVVKGGTAEIDVRGEASRYILRVHCQSPRLDLRE